jgi:hypothetical protein
MKPILSRVNRAAFHEGLEEPNDEYKIPVDPCWNVWLATYLFSPSIVPKFLYTILNPRDIGKESPCMQAQGSFANADGGSNTFS